MEREDSLRTWSFVMLLVGGILILVSGAVMAAGWGMWGTPMGGGMQDHMGTSGVWTGVWSWMAGWSILMGGLVIVAAFQVSRSSDVRSWGILGIVAGALSLFAMGGMLIGALSAIVGGALAVGAPRSGPAPSPAR